LFNFFCKRKHSYAKATHLVLASELELESKSES